VGDNRLPGTAEATGGTIAEGQYILSVDRKKPSFRRYVEVSTDAGQPAFLPHGDLLPGPAPSE